MGPGTQIPTTAEKSPLVATNPIDVPKSAGANPVVGTLDIMSEYDRQFMNRYDIRPNEFNVVGNQLIEIEGAGYDPSKALFFARLLGRDYGSNSEPEPMTNQTVRAIASTITNPDAPIPSPVNHALSHVYRSTDHLNSTDAVAYVLVDTELNDMYLGIPDKDEMGVRVINMPMLPHDPLDIEHIVTTALNIPGRLRIIELVEKSAEAPQT